MIWQNRLVKIEGDTVLMSARHLHWNFDFHPPKPTPDMAVAFTLPDRARVFEVKVLSDDRIMFNRQWVLTGNPCDGGRLDEWKGIAEPTATHFWTGPNLSQ